jgi:hypothetical protein
VKTVSLLTGLVLTILMVLAHSTLIAQTEIPQWDIFTLSSK